MTAATTISLAYAAIQAALTSHCYTGLVDRFDVHFFTPKLLTSKVLSYRDKTEPKAYITDAYIGEPCSVAQQIVFLSTYEHMADSFPEEKFPVKGVAQYFQDQMAGCCQKP